MDLNETILKFFADFIHQKVGIIYTEVTYYQLETRLESAAAHFS